eukprot:scaffold65752_cov58-Attheya_sp.AAC.1
MEGEKYEGPGFEVKLGVFLCSPKGNTMSDGYRMSLLWHSRANNLTKASNDFGSLIRATSDFNRWREEPRITGAWTYLGPDCCKVVNVHEDGVKESKLVLRSYDTRFRSTQRRSEIYEYYASENKIILNIGHHPEHDSAVESLNLWESEGKLLVIAAPFREGRHFAKTPAEFIPIFDALKSLHESGFVHGDIRGFNTVFTDAAEGEAEDKGWLIDFDFGGKEDKPTTEQSK